MPSLDSRYKSQQTVIVSYLPPVLVGLADEQQQLPLPHEHLLPVLAQVVEVERHRHEHLLLGRGTRHPGVVRVVHLVVVHLVGMVHGGTCPRTCPADAVRPHLPGDVQGGRAGGRLEHFSVLFSTALLCRQNDRRLRLLHHLRSHFITPAAFFEGGGCSYAERGVWKSLHVHMSVGRNNPPSLFFHGTFFSRPFPETTLTFSSFPTQQQKASGGHLKGELLLRSFLLLSFSQLFYPMYFFLFLHTISPATLP